MKRKIGFITSGGDAPGMNAAIRAIVKTSLYYNYIPVGFFDGYQGIIDNRFKEFAYSDVNNCIMLGGTILGSSRSEEYRTAEGRIKAAENLRKNSITDLIVIGGDGSFKGASLLSEEHGINIIGVPATIDNDIYGTDFTIGFDTAVNTVVEGIDKIRDTANSHKSMFLVEVMGRSSGYIALYAGMASGVEMVLIPEQETKIEKLAQEMANYNKGVRSSIFIVAEGDELGGALVLKDKLESYLSDFDIKACVLGHIQRGGRPSASDRILATRLGVVAVEAIERGIKDIMVGFSNNRVIEVSLSNTFTNKHQIDYKDLDLLKKLLTLSC